MTRNLRLTDIQLVFLSKLKEHAENVVGSEPKKVVLIKTMENLFQKYKKLALCSDLTNSEIEFFCTHRNKPTFTKRLNLLKENSNLFMTISNEMKSCSDEFNFVEVVEPINKTIRPDSFFSEKTTCWILEIATRGVKKEGHVIAIRESSSNYIIHYRYAENHLTEEFLIQFLLDTIELYGKPVKIGSENEWIKTLPNLTNLLDEKKIVIRFNGNLNSKSFNDDFWNCFGITKHSSATLPEWESLSFDKRSQIIDHIVMLFNYTKVAIRHDNFKGSSQDEFDKALRCYTAERLNNCVQTNNELAELIEKFHLYTVLSYQGDYIEALIKETLNSSNMLAVAALSKIPLETQLLQNLIHEANYSLSKTVAEGFLMLCELFEVQRVQNAQQLEEISSLKAELNEIKTHTSTLYSLEQEKQVKREKSKTTTIA